MVLGDLSLPPPPASQLLRPLTPAHHQKSWRWHPLRCTNSARQVRAHLLMQAPLRFTSAGQEQAMPVSGAWLLRDPPNQKPPIKLLNREEAQQAQRHLIERGYLLGPADGTWSLRSQAALLDFRRAQGLSLTRPGQAKGRAHLSRNPQAARNCQLKEPGSVEQVFPPDRPTELSDGIWRQEPNDFADEIANVTPERGHPAKHSNPRWRALCRSMGAIARSLLRKRGATPRNFSAAGFLVRGPRRRMRV